MTDCCSTPTVTLGLPNFDNLQARCLQGVTALIIWTIWSFNPRYTSIPFLVALLAPIPVVLLAADSLSRRPLVTRIPWLKSRKAIPLFAIATAVFAAGTINAVRSPTPTTDQPVTLLCAAQNIRSGIDPYTTYEPQCYRQVNYEHLNVTPLETGPFAKDTHYPSQTALTRALHRDERNGTHAGFPAFGYPPDAALLLLPIAYSNWTVVALWVAMLCLILGITIWREHIPARTYMVAWQLGALGLLLLAFGWNPEYISYLLLAAGFALIHRARWSALALAAAVCTNPLAWLAAPIYLAITAHYPQFKSRLMWLTGGSALLVLPWLIWDHALIAQMWRFITMPEFPIGAALGQFAHLPSTSHHIYFVAFIAAILIATFVAWRFEGWMWSMVVAVYLAFFVSWRGPIYYYLPALWLTPAVIAGQYRMNLRWGKCLIASPGSVDEAADPG